MNNSNTKIYLGISIALVVLFILILIVPFSKKNTYTLGPTPYTLPTPTSVETNQFRPKSDQSLVEPTVEPLDFTGAAEEELPPEILEASLQKKDLRQKTPLDLSTFTIEFDYNKDKFIVTLKDQKDLAQKEFESWKAVNYHALSAEQFLFK